MLFRQDGFDLIAQDLHTPMQMLSADARAITGEKIVGREREHKYCQLLVVCRAYIRTTDGRCQGLSIFGIDSL